MAIYDNSVNIGTDSIFTFLKERMKEKNIKQKELAQIIGVNKSTLVRNFKRETEMLLSTYLKICAALELNPYLIPKELNKDTFERISFN